VSQRASAAQRYAEAAFAVAREKGDIRGWLDDLVLLANVLTPDEVRQLFANPRLDERRRIGIALSLVPHDMKAERQNFLKLLVLGGRTSDIATIRRHFETLVAEAEGRLELQVTVPNAPDEEDRRLIEQLLAKRVGRETSVDYRIDPGIIGGLVIRRGDHVIDGSVRRRLQELRAQLIAS
jgi:F-type H+-transporting ATPase subunit delta